MKIQKSNTLACFSPPVMLATFIIEVVLIIYTLLFRKVNLNIRLVILLIAALAIFQLSEYGICENLGLNSNAWAKLGFESITILPPLGLHLVFSIAKKKSKLITVAYVGAAVWIGFFIFGNIMSGAVCEGNYVIFKFNEPFEGLYYVFYDTLLLLSMAIALFFARSAKNIQIKNALKWLVTGYASFIVPSMLFAEIDSHVGDDSQLPSVLCGFAILLAIILSLKVIPLVSKRKKL